MNKRIFYTKLAPYYDLLAPPTTELECRFLNDIFQKFGEGRVEKILDIGCGTGRHSCVLSRMGYQITGIDLSEKMIRIAKSKCPKVKFTEMNFMDMNFNDNSFDASICMWTTIGYLLNETDFKIFVRNIHSVTKRFVVLDSSNYENPAKGLVKEVGKRELKLPSLTIKSYYIRNFDRVTRVREEVYFYELFRGKKISKFMDKNRLRMWQLNEIADLLKPEFKILKVFGDYSLDSEFSKLRSDRKIILAGKK